MSSDEAALPRSARSKESTLLLPWRPISESMNGRAYRQTSAARRLAESMGKSAKPSDYDAIADPYCYPDTGVLKNIPGIATKQRLQSLRRQLPLSGPMSLCPRA